MTHSLPRAFAALVATLVLAGSAPTAADEGGVYIARDNGTALVTIPDCQDIWAKLPEIAERLGVAPTKRGSRLVLAMCDGRAYDVDELAVKLLDRLDRITK